MIAFLIKVYLEYQERNKRMNKESREVSIYLKKGELVSKINYTQTIPL